MNQHEENLALVSTAIIKDLIAVLHPGVVGLIGAHHGETSLKRACQAVIKAKQHLQKLEQK